MSRLHAPLAVEQRRVAPGAGLECLDVVGELALEVLGRLLSVDREHPAALAAKGSGGLAQDPVLGVELGCGDRCSPGRF